MQNVNVMARTLGNAARELVLMGSDVLCYFRWPSFLRTLVEDGANRSCKRRKKNDGSALEFLLMNVLFVLGLKVVIKMTDNQIE